MTIVSSTPLAVIGVSSIAVLAASSVSIAYHLYHQRSETSQNAIQSKRIEVYHDIMSSVIKLNRMAVELEDEDELEDAHERLILNQDSELDTHLDDTTERFHRSYYIIDPSVRDAVSEYVDYVSSYQEMGIQVGRILSLSGNIVMAMREDLGLPDIFADAADHGKRD